MERLLLPIALIATVLAYRNSRRWGPLLCLSMLAAGLAYASLRDVTRSPRSQLPEREVSLGLSIERLFEDNAERARGFATVVSTPSHLADLANVRVYFSLYKRERISTAQIEIGSLVSVEGVLAPTAALASDSGGFAGYLKASGVGFQLSRGVIESVDDSIGGWRLQFNRIQKWAHGCLTRGIDPNAAPTRSYVAMMLGKKNELEDDRKELFLKSGALHLFAISGLHIGIIAACGHATLVLLRLPRRWIPIPNLTLIAIFVLATGGAPSAWRALLMIACYYLCVASKRQAASLNALVLSALICLLVDPRQLFLAGFQMSYATVAAILLYGVPLAERLTDRWKPFRAIPRKAWSLPQTKFYEAGRFVINSFAISLSAFLASSALSIAYFQTLPILGILANIVLLPLAFLAIVAGFLAILFGGVGIGPAILLFNNAAQVVLATMHAFLESLNRLPRSYLLFEGPPIGLLLLMLSLLLVGLLFGYDRRWSLPRAWLWLGPLLYPALCILAGSL